MLAHWLNGEQGCLGVSLLFALYFLKSYVMMPSEKARNRAGAFQVGLG